MDSTVTLNVEDQFGISTVRIATVDDYAIFDHVFRIERGDSDGPSTAISPLVISESQLDEFRKALLLNRPINDRDLDAIMRHPGLYRMLLYYHLMTLNRSLVDGGWIGSIDPVYSVEKMDASSSSPTADRYNYVSYINDVNEAYDNYLTKILADQGSHMKFPIRLIYAPVIETELIRRPFSTRTHRTIESMIQDRAFRYESRSTNDIVVHDDWLKEWRENDIQFYSDIDQVPKPEWILNVDKFRTSGVYGTTFLGRLGGNIPVFMKYSNVYEYDPVHEYRVGEQLNEYYSECPFMMYTYGITKLNMSDYTLNNYQAILDNQSDYDLEGDKSRTVLISQWATNSISFGEFILDESIRVVRYDAYRNIVEVEHEDAIQQILMAILCSLKYLWNEIGFVHGDLHLGNIQIMRFDTPQVLPLPGYPGRQFNLSVVPILIDYGMSSVLRPHSSPITSVILPLGSESVWNVTEKNIVTDQVYVGDIVKLLVHTFVGVASSYPKLGNLIASTYYHVFTGNQPESEFVERTIYEELMSKIGPDASEMEEMRDRLPPAGLTTFDPDRAITEFVDQSYRISNLRSNREPIFSVDDRIDNMIKQNGLTISTYVGAVVYQLYKSTISHEPIYTDGVIKSWNDLQRILETNYIRALELLLEVMEGYDNYIEAFKTVKDSLEIQYVYRGQINQLIKTTIPE